MSNKLSDRTNSVLEATEEVKGVETDKVDSVVEYLKSAHDITNDYNLKYNLSKCIEILEGKENQEMKDMKESLFDVLAEKERLFKENCELHCELEALKRNMSE